MENVRLRNANYLLIRDRIESTEDDLQTHIRIVPHNQRRSGFGQNEKGLHNT